MRIESILLLEKIASHLARRVRKAYLSIKEIRELYYLLCEEMEDEAAKYLFSECLDELINSGVLLRSSFNENTFI
ncbi:MAG: hypothetical protein ACTSYM_10505 [Candidatus Baldrarchaeia archaeon]